VGLSHNAFDRDLEANADYYSLTQKLAYAPLKCTPVTSYSYQNIAFSLIGDVVQAAGGQSYAQAVENRIFRPLGMHDASVGLDGILTSPRWARPHVRTRGGWMSLTPKPTYYRVAPAAGVNASASDMAQWLLAHTGHRPDVLPAPLLATLHQPLVETPGELRGSAWRRERLYGASYALGWRVYDYAGSQLVFHGGAVQGYRGVVALLPDRDLGIALMWNSESSLPSGMLPTMLDRAIGLSGRTWLEGDLGADTLYVNTTAPGNESQAHVDDAGTVATKATSAPE
jgi:beta-lactamase class C